MTEQPTTKAIPISDDAAEHMVDAYDDAGEQEPEAKAAGMMTNDFFVHASQRTDGKPGNPEANALLAEIKRRGLDA